MTTKANIKLQFNLSYTIAKKREDFYLSANHELNLAQGIVGVYGDSGQGKSTFLKLLAGLIQSERSEVNWRIDEKEGLNKTIKKPISAKSKLPPENSPAVYQNQDVSLFEHMTVEQNLLFVQKHSVWSVSSERPINLKQVIDWCGITDLLKQQANSLSGGEKQRVGLARSLLSGKPVILLDEPFSALDWNTRVEMLALLKKLNKELQIGFVLVSHSLQELALSCEYLLHFEQGNLTKGDTIEQMLPRLSLGSSEPIFSRLLLSSPTYYPEYHLTKWQLSGSDKHSIYCSSPNNQKQSDKQKDDNQKQASELSKVVAVQADKVSLSKQPLNQSSMLNQVSGEITQLQPFEHLVLVTIDVNRQQLYSLVSELSANKLELELGQTIFALFKAL